MSLRKEYQMEQIYLEQSPHNNGLKKHHHTERPTSKIRGAIFLENRISVSIKTFRLAKYAGLFSC